MSSRKAHPAEDDLHLLADPKVLDGLDYMLRNVGPGLRLVVSSRMDPPELARYDLIHTERDGVPAPAPRSASPGTALGVLAGVLDHDGQQLSATQTRHPFRPARGPRRSPASPTPNAAPTQRRSPRRWTPARTASASTPWSMGFPGR